MSRTVRHRGLVPAFIVLAAAASWVGCSPTPPSCVYNLSRTAVSLPAAGGSEIVTVTTTAGCTWTATSSAAWLTITSGGSGTGSGSVGFSATANGPSSRSATLTVAGQSVAVSQDGAPAPTYSLSGKITDVFMGPSATGFGLPGVAVTVAGGPSQGSATTDFTGTYTVSGLLAGTYTVTFQKTHFRPASATIAISGPATLPMTLSLDTPASPSTSNLTGYWTGVGTYPNNPFKLALIQTGNQFRGWYMDSKGDWSPDVTEWPAGGGITMPEFTLLVRFGDAGLLLECVVEDARRMKGVQRTPSLGNRPFPFDMTR